MATEVRPHQQHRQRRNNVVPVAMVRSIIFLLGLIWLCTTLYFLFTAPMSSLPHHVIVIDRKLSDAGMLQNIYDDRKGQGGVYQKLQSNNNGTDKSKDMNTEIELSNPVNLTGIYFHALDEVGKHEYVHNATFLRHNPPIFDKSGIRCEPNDATFQLLTKRVYVDLAAHERAEKLVLDKRGNNNNKHRAKIFCHIYTTNKHRNLVQTIRETWGQRCDGFLAASTVTDISIDSVFIPHEGKEIYGNMWQKVRAMWTYVYVNYFDAYDWFHIGGDDMYVIVENLRLYLESEEIVNASNGGELPLLLGQQFYQDGNKSKAYVTGGGGYTLNKVALKTLVTSFPNCAPHDVTSGEDLMITRCLQKQGIDAYWTTDAKGAERYNHVHPETDFNYDPKKNPLFWYTYYTAHNENVGPERVVERPVSFHVKLEAGAVEKPTTEYSMKRIDAILYGHCANATLGPPVPTKGWSDGKILWNYWKSPSIECELKAKADEICICSERKVNSRKTVQTCKAQKKKQEIITNNTSHQRLPKTITVLQQSHAELSEKLKRTEASLKTVLDDQKQIKSGIE